jgi:hypothetical protein
MSEIPLEYYELQKITIEPTKPGEFRLVTAAVVTCGLCGGMIDGMGGPGCGAVCVRCAEVVMRGQARGAIKWSDES